MNKKPKLRDGKTPITQEPFPLNQIPRDVILSLGGYFVYLIHIGNKDITGSDWGDALAHAVDGKHLDSPVGIADVILEKQKTAWSAKTVKCEKPHAVQNVRLISGRCSPRCSMPDDSPSCPGKPCP